MVSGVPPVGITQNERFLSHDTVLLGVRYINQFIMTLVTKLSLFKINP
jgi:hypothetical protein